MNLKSIFMSMLAVAALASCNNDDEIPGGTQEANASSWVGIKVSIPASSFGGTRAADANDANADESETAIKTISLYYKKADGTVDAITTSLAISDFTKSGATYTANKAVKIPVAAGSSVDIYAVVNNGAVTNPIRPNWFNLRGTAADPDINYWTATASELSNKEDKGFVMTGKGTGTTAETEEHATNASITIGRAVAKVLVTASKNGIDPTTDFDETNINGVSGKFKANSLCWTIGNKNKKLYLLQNEVDGIVKDPNWSKIPTGTGDAALADDYEDRNPTTYSTLVPAYSDVIETGYKTDGTSCVQYCNENTNEEYQYGNTTFISVKAVFVPNKIVTTVSGSVDTNDLNLKAETNTGGVATFYYYSAESKYLTEAAYEAAKTAGLSGSDFKGPYNGGECYYFVPITDKDGKTGVLRNSYYKMHIKSLRAPGEPTPNPGDNEDPVVQNSWIGVDFTVAPWTVQSMGDFDLE